MRKRILIVAASVFAFIAGWIAPGLYTSQKPVPIGEIAPIPQGEGWVNLLEGQHRDAWENISDDSDIFEISDDMLHIFGKSIRLKYVGYTLEDLDNFDLHVEVKVAPGTNSGIFVRSQRDDPLYRGFEIQVLDDFGSLPTKNGSGAIYDVVTPMYNMAFSAGEWNSYDIKLDEHHVVVEMNGWKVIDTDLSKMTTPLGKFEVAYRDISFLGMLLFQDHGGETWYRNIYLRKDAPAPTEAVSKQTSPAE